jgi:hypothetical protein
MSKTNDGGPAFPIPSKQHVHWEGMSLRDWFAGMALQGLAVMHAAILTEENSPELPPAEATAKAAYEIADAMLTRRNQQESQP